MLLQLQKKYYADFIFWLFRCVRRSSVGGYRPESLRFCEESCPRRNGICQRLGQGYRLGKHFLIHFLDKRTSPWCYRVQKFKNYGKSVMGFIGYVTYKP